MTTAVPDNKEKSLGPVATVQKMLEDNKRQLALALPKHLTMDRLLRTSLTAFQRNPKLLECHPATLGGAVMMCAIWGVEPIGPGGAWLVPFMNKKKNRMEVQFIVDYRAMANIARNSGEVKKVEWHEVHAKDSFTYRYGTDPKIEHAPYQGEGDAGPMTHVYAIGFFKDGTPQFIVLTRDEALKAKARSKAKDYGPWQTDETQMCLKTVVRRLCNQLPMSPEKQRLVGIEARADIGIPQDLGTLIDPAETITEAEEVEPEPYTMPQAYPKALDEKPEAKGLVQFAVGSVAKTTIGDKQVILVKTETGAKFHAGPELFDFFKVAEKAGHRLEASVESENGKEWIEEVKLSASASKD